MNFTSTIGKAGLSCETAQGAYWIWVRKDGTVEREINCKPVEDFAASLRKARTMEMLFCSLKDQILAYLNAADTAEGTRIWWQIKDAVRQAE
jgi:hypothetical protein